MLNDQKQGAPSSSFTLKLCVRHNKEYTPIELAYLCSQYDQMSKMAIGQALGRKTRTIVSMACRLKKNGDFEFYKAMGKELGVKS